MVLLQLSAGQGPSECCLAVGLALKALEKECREHKVALTIVEQIPSDRAGCFKSVLVQLQAQNETQAQQLAETWQGAMLWICQSPFRPKHKRKNWFFSGQVFQASQTPSDRQIEFQTCRSSGAGGQHVNTTESAVRATDKISGVSVRVESERSQHANKRLALLLLERKIALMDQEQSYSQDRSRWQQHKELERGNPRRTFKGIKFT